MGDERDGPETTMREEVFDATLSLIHDTALRPAAWDDVLRRLAALTGCAAGGLTRENPYNGRGTPITYFGFDPQHVEKTFEYFLPLNPLFSVAPRMQSGLIITNGDVVPTEAFRRSEFYDGWARPQGLCSPITLVTHSTPHTYIPLTLVRPDGSGEASDEDRAMLSRFAPHVMHAVRVGLQLESAAAKEGHLFAALACLPQPALLVDTEHRVVFANAAGEAFLGRSTRRLLDVADGKLLALDASMDATLQAILSRAVGEGGSCSGGAMMLQPLEPGGAVQLTVTPLRSDGFWEAAEADNGAARCCLVLIDDRSLFTLAERHGLTPAETRLAEAVVVGKGLAWAACQLNISRSTAQSHLDKVFQKTNTRRQAELVAFVRQGGRG